MEMHKNKRCCKDCSFYDLLYVKFVYSFEKQSVGFCMQKNIVVQNDYICKCYKRHMQKDKTVTLEHIDFVIADIEELQKIFYNFDC